MNDNHQEHSWSLWLMVAGSNVKWRRCTGCGLEEQEMVEWDGDSGIFIGEPIPTKFDA